MESRGTIGTKRRFCETDLEDGYSDWKRSSLLDESRRKVHQLVMLQTPRKGEKGEKILGREPSLQRIVLIQNMVRLIENEMAQEGLTAFRPLEATDVIPESYPSQASQAPLPGICSFIFPLSVYPPSPAAVPVDPSEEEESVGMGLEPSVTDLSPCGPLETPSHDGSFLHSTFPHLDQTFHTFPYSTVHCPIPSLSCFSSADSVVMAESHSLETPYNTPLFEGQLASSDCYTITSIGEGGSASDTPPQWPYSDGSITSIEEDNNLSETELMDLISFLKQTADADIDSDQSLAQPSTSQTATLNSQCSTHCHTDSPKDPDGSVQIAVGN